MGIGITESYRAGTFDCSNMAAYLQWRLKSQGYDARICLSKHFRGEGHHAWVAVDLQGVRYYIDATDPALMTLGPYSESYREYDAFEQICGSIYDLVLEHPLTDFVWWSQLNFSAEARRLGASG